MDMTPTNPAHATFSRLVFETLVAHNVPRTPKACCSFTPPGTTTTCVLCTYVPTLFPVHCPLILDKPFSCKKLTAAKLKKSLFNVVVRHPASPQLLRGHWTPGGLKITAPTLGNLLNTSAVSAHNRDAVPTPEICRREDQIPPIRGEFGVFITTGAR